MKIKISKAIFFDFVYTSICIFVLLALNDFNNFWLIFFSFLCGTIGSFVYVLFKEAEDETKS